MIWALQHVQLGECKLTRRVLALMIAQVCWIAPENLVRKTLSLCAIELRVTLDAENQPALWVRLLDVIHVSKLKSLADIEVGWDIQFSLSTGIR